MNADYVMIADRLCEMKLKNRRLHNNKSQTPYPNNVYSVFKKKKEKKM